MKYATKARVHVIRSSRIYALLVVGSLIAVWNCFILNPSEDGAPVRVPAFLRLGSYKLGVHEYTDLQIIHGLPKPTTKEWTARCPDECGAGKSRGICDGVRCVCYEGYGASDCGVGIDVFFAKHDVYHNLTVRPLDLGGWDLGGDLYKYLVRSLSPYLIIEVGVWKGASAIKLASALKEQGFGVMIAVDTWLPVLQFWQDQKALNRMQDLDFLNGYPRVYYTFLSNVVQMNLTDFTIPLPAMSSTAAELLHTQQRRAELIHIDAGHSYAEVAEDIRIWWKVLRKGGILLGDDWSMAWPGVLEAVREHARHHHVDIHIYRNKWWVYKPSH